jgi:hypothetical protein
MSTTVSPNSFLDAIRAKWAKYGNVGSLALDQVWLQIADTMNRQTMFRNPRERRWHAYASRRLVFRSHSSPPRLRRNSTL